MSIEEYNKSLLPEGVKRDKVAYSISKRFEIAQTGTEAGGLPKDDDLYKYFYVEIDRDNILLNIEAFEAAVARDLKVYRNRLVNEGKGGTGYENLESARLEAIEMCQIIARTI